MISIRVRQCVIVGFTLLYLVACGKDLSEEEYLLRAQNYMTESNFSSAVIELKNAVKQNKNSARARLMLGQAYFEIGDLESSEKELTRIQASASIAHRNILLPVLAQVWVLRGKHDQVLELKLDNLEPASLAIVLAAQSRSYMSRSELKLASQKIQLALSFSADSVYTLNAKARLLYYQREVAAADELLTKIHEIDPNDMASWGLHGDLKRTMGDVTAANEFYTRAIDLDPSGLGYMMKRAFSRIQSQEYELAQEDIDILLEQAPHNTQVNYARGLVLFFDKQYEEAISALVVAEPDKFSFPQLLMYLGLAHYENGNFDRAYFYVQDFYAIVQDHPVANKLLATLWVENGKYDDAEQLIRTVLELHPEDTQALNILANTLVKQQRVDEAVEILSEVLELEPDSVRAQVRLSVGYVNMGRRDEAISLIENAIDLDPEFGQADMVLVLTHLKEKDLDSALQAAQNYQQRDPANVVPLLLIGRVHREAGDMAAARSSFLQAIELDPGNPSANHRLAVMAFAQKDLDAARKYYKAVLKEHKHFLNTLIALAALEASIKDYDAMVAYLDEAVEAHPQAVQPKVVLARYYLSTGRPDKVAVSLSGLSDNQKNTPTILRLAAKSQFAQAQYADARYSIERVIGLGHGSSDDHRMLASVYKQLGRDGKARSQLQKALEIFPDSVESHLAMATYAFTHADAPLLKKHMAAIEELSPENPQLKRLQAAYARVSGDQGRALALFEEIHSSSPTTGSMLNLQKQYELSGDKDAARKLLLSWVAQHTEDSTARMALAGNYLASGDNELLVEEYIAILALDETNVVALNNMAWSLKETNPKLALEYAEQASAIAHKSPTVLDTMALVQSANGLHEQAWDTIQKVIKLDADNPGFIYHSALISSAWGRPAEALDILKKLLQESKRFPQRDEATQLMESLLPNH